MRASPRPHPVLSLCFHPRVAWQSEAGERIAVSKYKGADALKKKKKKKNSTGFIVQKTKLHVLTGANIFQKSKGGFPAPGQELCGTSPFVRAEMAKQLSAFKSGKFVKRESRMLVTTTGRRRLG